MSFSPPAGKSVIHATGWLSYSVFFNILNTIVYSTLYPNLLRGLTDSDASFSVGFSIINTLTTLFSAVLLPLLGSLTDQLKIIKSSLIVTSFIGWFVTILLIFALVPLKLLNVDWVSMLFTESIYIVAMFFLRISVMNNNALLPCFEYKSRSILSILGNCLGFSVNLVGLGIIRLWPKKWSDFMDGSLFGISTKGWWVVICTIFSGCVGVWMVLSPSGASASDETTTDEVDSTDIFDNERDASTIVSPSSVDVEVPATAQLMSEKTLQHSKKQSTGDSPKPEPPSPTDELEEYIRQAPPAEKKTLSAALFLSFRSLLETITHWRSNSEYFNSWIFLFSYLFFSGPGVVFTVTFTFLFISVYPEVEENLNASVDLNLYYKIFMVIGVFFGLLFDKVSRLIFKSSKYIDLCVLLVQNFIFGLFMLGVFILISLDVHYSVALWASMPIGFFYSWNASVARGLMSKLIPMEKKGEFMGFYSTFTYLGITIVSGIDAAVKALGAPPQTLLLLLFMWSLPGFIFLIILGTSMRRKEAA